MFLNKQLLASVKQNGINRMAKFFIVITIIAIMLQLLWVPHRLYTVTISSQRVPHETFDCIRYNWLTSSFAVMGYTGKPERTSKVAYDIVAVHIIMTITVSGSLYFLLSYLRNTREKRQEDKEQEFDELLHEFAMDIGLTETEWKQFVDKDSELLKR